MLLPAAVQQTIDQIIAATGDVSPDLVAPMQNELAAQLEALIFQRTQKTLDAQSKQQLDKLLSAESPDTQRISAFMADNPRFDTIVRESVEQLRALYLE